MRGCSLLTSERSSYAISARSPQMRSGFEPCSQPPGCESGAATRDDSHLAGQPYPGLRVLHAQGQLACDIAVSVPSSAPGRLYMYLMVTRRLMQSLPAGAFLCDLISCLKTPTSEAVNAPGVTLCILYSGDMYSPLC